MLRVGDKVVLHPDVYNFTYGQGHAVYEEIGIIQDIYERDDDDYQIIVRFPSAPYGWRGVSKEVQLVRGQSKYFKCMQGEINTNPISPIFGGKHVQS